MFKELHSIFKISTKSREWTNFIMHFNPFMVFAPKVANSAKLHIFFKKIVIYP